MIDSYLEIKSIDPKFWGRSGWIFLNSIALTYNPDYREQYKQFILQLPWILPCKTCGENLRNNISTLDIALETKESFIKWLINLRNDIYEENGQSNKKKNMQKTFDEIFYQECDSKLYIYICILFVVLVLLLYVYKNFVEKKDS